MLEFDLVLCFLVLVLVAYFERKGISVKNRADNTLIKEVNSNIIGNRFLYALPFFLFLTIVADLESQRRLMTSSVVIIYFMAFLVLFFGLFVSIKPISFLGYFTRLRFIYNQMVKLADKGNKDEIALSKADFIFMINEVLLAWMAIFTASILMAKCIYYLTN